MGIKVIVKTTVDVNCDYPGGCGNSFETVTEAGLMPALTDLGWRILNDDECYCKDHAALLQASGKLGPRNG